MVIVGLANGAVIALVKGNDSGVRYDIGKDVALWLVLPAALGVVGRGMMKLEVLGLGILLGTAIGSFSWRTE